jgi:hypothetical protein
MNIYCDVRYSPLVTLAYRKQSGRVGAVSMVMQNSMINMTLWSILFKLNAVGKNILKPAGIFYELKALV